MIEALSFPPGLEAWTASALIIASAVTSFITAAFGIGGGVTLLAIMAVLLPPATLIPIHGLVQLGSNGGRVVLMLNEVKRSILAPFILGSLIGVAAGGHVFVQLPASLVQLAIGLFIIWSVLGTLPAIGRGHVVAAGSVSSFLTMFFGATGVFISALVKSLNLPPVHHVATHSALMTLQHLLKVIAFSVIGFAFGPYWLLIVAMILSGFIGTVFGRHLLQRLGGRYFKPILNTLLLVLAMRLIWSGGSTFLAASNRF